MFGWRSVVLGLAGVVVVACAARGDYTPPIEVSGDPAARLCRFMPSKCPTAKVVTPDAGVTAGTRLHPFRAGDALGGPNATGKPGDWVLENDEVVFVIDGLGGGGGFAESGGNLVDAADARARKDELGMIFTYFGDFPRQAVYESLDTDVKLGVPVLVARGHELHEKELEVVTTYRLGHGDRALLVSTSIANRGQAKVVLPGLGDAIQWGGAEKVAPGKPAGFKGRARGPYLGGVGKLASYAITSTDGDIGSVNGSSWSDTIQAEKVSIEPGGSVFYDRVIVVGERPDTASLVAELSKASDLPVAPLAFTLLDAKGTPLAEPPVGAKILLSTTKGDPVMNVVAARRTGGVALEAEVPPGTYVASFVPSAGRGPLPGSAPMVVEARAGATGRASLRVTDAANEAFGPCEEGTRVVPCKITIEGEGATPSPDFGPGHVAGPAKNQIVLGPGEIVHVPLAPGRYRATASRGPEHELAAIAFVTPGPARGAFQLRRVLDTTGWIATDFHQHTVQSADAPVSARDRVLANAAEGVEVAVASEHNVVADFSAIVKEAKLAPFTVSVPGNELTSDASRAPWGHANVYPVPVKADAPRGGAPAVRDREPRELFAEARALPGARVIQVNHPRSGANGFFDLLGFDPTTAKATSPAYAEDFDALEVWNGRNIDGRTKTLVDFFALLRAGKRVTAIADTDTHGIVGQEAGYPRTYVRVPKDDALDAWDAARTDALVTAVRAAREVVLTNGPFVTVAANGEGIGGTAKARNGRVDVEVVVQTASWNAVDTAEIRLAGGGATVTGAREVSLVAGVNASGARQARASFALRVPPGAKDAFVVVVRGKTPMRPVLAGDDAEISPWAMTGAVWLAP